MDTTIEFPPFTPPVGWIVILYGVFMNMQVRRSTGVAGVRAAIQVCIPVILQRRIRRALDEKPTETKLEAYVRDFVSLRDLEGGTIPVTFICVGLNPDTLALIQIFYPPDVAHCQYKYEVIDSAPAALAKYPDYFQELETRTPSCSDSSPFNSPLAPLHDNSISCIFPGQLYLSGTPGSNLIPVCSNGITHILYACDLPPEYPHNNLQFLQIPIADHGDVKLAEHIPTAMAFIKSAINSGGRVLVHCFAGKSRSASFVIAYIMMTQQKPYIEALKYVQERRPVVEPNFGFECQLKELEAKLIAGTLENFSD